MKTKSIKTFFIAVMVVAVVIVSAVYIIPLAHNRSQNVSLGMEWAHLLRKHSTFSAKHTGYPVDVNFQCAAPTDSNLRKPRRSRFRNRSDH
jgi:hypothetical protein